MTAQQRMVAGRQMPVRFTADEFIELAQYPPVAERAGKIELVQGEVVRMSPANIPHWRIRHDVARKLQEIYRVSRPDWMVGTEPSVRFADTTVRLPDIGVLASPDVNGPSFSQPTCSWRSRSPTAACASIVAPSCAPMPTRASRIAGSST